VMKGGGSERGDLRSQKTGRQHTRKKGSSAGAGDIPLGGGGGGEKKKTSVTLKGWKNSKTTVKHAGSDWVI